MDFCASRREWGVWVKSSYVMIHMSKYFYFSWGEALNNLRKERTCSKALALKNPKDEEYKALSTCTDCNWTFKYPSTLQTKANENLDFPVTKVNFLTSLFSILHSTVPTKSKVCREFLSYTLSPKIRVFWEVSFFVIFSFQTE